MDADEVVKQQSWRLFHYTRRKLQMSLRNVVNSRMVCPQWQIFYNILFVARSC